MSGLLTLQESSAARRWKQGLEGECIMPKAGSPCIPSTTEQHLLLITAYSISFAYVCSFDQLIQAQLSLAECWAWQRCCLVRQDSANLWFAHLQHQIFCLSELSVWMTLAHLSDEVCHAVSCQPLITDYHKSTMSLQTVHIQS